MDHEPLTYGRDTDLIVCFDLSLHQDWSEAYIFNLDHSRKRIMSKGPPV